jgi:hypothetical protein
MTESDEHTPSNQTEERTNAHIDSAYSLDEILQHLPESETSQLFREWVSGNVSSCNMTVEGCIEGLKASNGTIAIGGAQAGGDPGWAYYLNNEGEFKCWMPGTEIRDTDEASEMLSNDLDATGLDVMAMIAADQPTPVGNVTDIEMSISEYEP